MTRGMGKSSSTATRNSQIERAGMSIKEMDKWFEREELGNVWRLIESYWLIEKDIGCDSEIGATSNHYNIRYAGLLGKPKDES